MNIQYFCLFFTEEAYSLASSHSWLHFVFQYLYLDIFGQIWILKIMQQNKCKLKMMKGYA